MRKPIIVGNWKMNKTRAEAKEFTKAVEEVLTGNENATYGIAAPFTCVSKVVKHAEHMIVATQNCHFEDSGAFTGEVSVPMLQDIEVTYCIIGHSERRQMFNETDETVNKKAKRLLAAGITPIVCFGETEAQYDALETEAVIRSQLAGSLAGLTAEEAGSLVLAYEPIWAIGTGKSADSTTAQNCCHIVRDQVRAMFNDDAAAKVRIQYGGSVKPNNIKEYMSMEDIDGALIGGASLKAESWIQIIEATK